MEPRFKPYFDANPKVNVFYFTTDGQAFIDIKAAERHQGRLTGKATDVNRVSRQDDVPKQVPKAGNKSGAGSPKQVPKAGNKPVDKGAEDVKEKKEALEKELEETQGQLTEAAADEEKEKLAARVDELKQEILKLK